MILLNIKNNIIWFFQRTFRGYSDIECWNLGSYTAKYMLPRLKCFRKNLHGCPANIYIESLKKYGLKPVNSNTDSENYKKAESEAFKEWESIIDKIIFSLEYTLVDSGFMTEKAFCEKNNVAYDEKTFYTEFLAKYEEGISLLGKHFTSLWD